MARNAVQLAPEGKPIVIGAAVAAIVMAVSAALFDSLLWDTFAVVSTLFLLFSLIFFRDPSRVFPSSPAAIVSPADGRVVFAGPAPGSAAETLIAIFLSPLNVHVNRVPADGTVESVSHTPGRFVGAFRPEAAEVNERTDVVILGARGRVRVRQVAGFLARRILCHIRPGDPVSLGDRLGFIRFGSRTDLILPATASIRVAVGDKVRGGVTILGEWK